MKKRWLPLLILMVAPPLAARAAEPSGKIIEYGRYSEKITGFTPAEGTSGNVLIQSSGTVHVETTKRIPARVGESFGILVKFSDLPKDRPFVIRDVTFHPPIKQPDGSSLTESVDEVKFAAGTQPKDLLRFSRWTFVKGFEYELVPGKWTASLSVDGKEVSRMDFEVYKP